MLYVAKGALGAGVPAVATLAVRVCVASVCDHRAAGGVPPVEEHADNKLPAKRTRKVYFMENMLKRDGRRVKDVPAIDLWIL